MKYYKKQALSQKPNKVINGLYMLIQTKDFCMTSAELKSIKHSTRDKRVGGWLFAYNFYATSIRSKNLLLRKNLKNPNPRIREQVCDIIGDEFIEELRPYLKLLFNDPISNVCESARYNYDEMF